MSGSFQVVGHTADTALDVAADTLGGLFEWAARGMFTLMFDLDDLVAVRSVAVHVAARQVDELLIDLLSELLYIAESGDVVPCAFVASEATTTTEVSLAVGVVPLGTAVLVGPPIKAVTYHALAVGQREDGWWTAHLVFDV